MIKCENISVMNFENAVRGMRNSFSSWNKSDSYIQRYPDNNSEFVIGPNDLDLMKRLIKAGSDERKFMRQIFVSIDITTSLIFWKEMDQYKVSTVTNSTSTMHTLTKQPITKDLFSLEHSENVCGAYIDKMILECELLRQKYLETNDKQYWRALIDILPESFNQTRTWTANYEVLRNIYHARKNHRLDEWHEFCAMIETLPYAELITM